MPDELQGQVPPTVPVTPQVGTMTLEQALARIKDYEKEVPDLRKESASYRVKAKELDERNAKDAAEQLTEVEWERQARTQAETKVKSYQAKLAAESVKSAAQKLGITDPDVAAHMVATSLEYDDDGAPKNTEAALRDLLKAHPSLANAGSLAGSVANPSSHAVASSNQRFTTAQLADLDFYNKNLTAIHKAMREGRID